MAERRMFAKTIIDSDAFLEMPSSTQMLYFHLAMRADDEGFVNNPRRIQKMIGAADDDMKILIAKKFILIFESGVIVIKHWKIHNYIRNDRIHETKYKDEKAMLSEDENNSYTLSQTNVSQLADNCHTEVRIGKDSLGKDSIKEDKEEKTRHKYGSYKNVLLSDKDLDTLKIEFPDDWENRIERVSGYQAQSGKTYKDYLAVIRNWARKDKERENSKPTTPQNNGRPTIRGNFEQRKYDDDFYDKLMRSD